MTTWQAWTGITDLADQAVVLPLALLVFLALLSRRRGSAGAGPAARAWALAVGGVLVALLALKLWAGACAGTGPAGEYGILHDLGVRSPSGHTAAGGIVYGGLLALALRRGALVSALCCLAAAATFGASRLALGLHTPAEVALGCAVAAGGGTVLARAGGWPCPAAGPAPRLRDGAAWVRSDSWAWAMAALALVWTLHGRRLAAEVVIAKVASGWLSPFCGW